VEGNAVTTSHSGSALILQFPLGGQSGLAKSGRLIDRTWKPEVVATPKIMPESGWYHDVAAQTETPQKN
jgi:hypothetical protein